MIMIFASHPDDDILGCGGTIAKFVESGEKVVSVIFSYGELSNPLLDPKMLAKKRREECENAAKILGVNEQVFLRVKDKPFSNKISDKVEKRAKELLKKHNPEAIFTHCIDDPHPFHREVAKRVKKITKEAESKALIYTFETGGLFRFVHRNKPKLYVDISNVIEQKKQAIAQFDKIHEGIIYYKALILLKNKLAGIRIKRKYAEVFYTW